MKGILKKQLGKILLEKGLVNFHHIEEVLKIQKETGGVFGKIMVEKVSPTLSPVTTGMTIICTII